MRSVVTAVLAGFVLCASPMALPASASPTADLASAYNSNTDAAFRVGLQTRLAWTGDYDGAFDGRIGAQTLRAIREFQARHGFTADGVMDETFLKRVITESDKVRDTAGYKLTDDPATGVRLGLPLALVSPAGETEVGRMWRSGDGNLEIETVRFRDENYSLRSVYDVLSTESDTKTVTAAELRDDGFSVSGTDAGRNYVIRFSGRDNDLRGFSVAWRDGADAVVKPYLAVALNSFRPFAGEPDSRETGPVARLMESGRAEGVAFGEPALSTEPRGDKTASAAPGFDSSGTGFVVSDDGWLLTNAHVAKACKTVLVGDLGAASQVVVDEANDLALVKMDAELGKPLPIVSGKPRLGEDVLALGFPLRSILADSLNVTRGNVSSLMGLRNDANYLQISAAVQPGNSGGPLIDLAGRVVGVVTAKLNAVAVADLTGDIPQSINFAIRPDAAAKFLTDNGIDFRRADESVPLTSVPDATASVQESIYPILCLGQN